MVDAHLLLLTAELLSKLLGVKIWVDGAGAPGVWYLRRGCVRAADDNSNTHTAAPPILLIIVYSSTGTTNTRTEECHSMLCLANMHNA